MGRLIVLLFFFSLLLFVFFFPPKFCLAEISVTTGRIVLKISKFGECEVVQQCFNIRNVGLEGQPTGVPKTAQLLSRLFLTNH